MNVVKKKLNNTRGASMLIALIYLLTALMVGTVVLTAASSNVGRITHNRQDQREYYAVESAMELVRSDLKNNVFTASYSRIEEKWTTSREIGKDKDGNPIYEPVENYKDDGYTKDPEVEMKSKLLNQKLTDFRKLFFSKASELTVREAAPNNMVYGLSFAASEGMPETVGTLTVNADYTITVVLYAKDSMSNPVTMTYRPISGNTEETVSVQNWTDERGVSITKTIHSTTIKWGEPSIMKGVSE